MKTEKGYRYTISFNDDTQEKVRAGTFLERSGHKKGMYIVSALAEYLDSHPELEDQPLYAEVKVRQSITREQVEGIVRDMLSEYRFTATAGEPKADAGSEEPSADEAFVSKMVDTFDKFF